MKCRTCPKTTGACLGERLSHLCGRADYRDYLATYEEDAPARPGLAAMAGNLAKAVAGHIADGGRLASLEVQAARRAECLSNRCGQHDAARDRCTACGCIAMDLKRSWASSSCPLGRWSAV